MPYIKTSILYLKTVQITISCTWQIDSEAAGPISGAWTGWQGIWNYRIIWLILFCNYTDIKWPVFICDFSQLFYKNSMIKMIIGIIPLNEETSSPSLFLSQFPSFDLCRYFFLSLSMYISPSLRLPIFLSPSLHLPIFLSLSPSPYLSLPLSISLSFSSSLPPSLSHTFLTISLFHYWYLTPIGWICAASSTRANTNVRGRLHLQLSCTGCHSFPTPCHGWLESKQSRIYIRDLTGILLGPIWLLFSTKWESWGEQNNSNSFTHSFNMWQEERTLLVFF